MKNILLLVHDDAGQQARLEAAIDLAWALEGHVICLDVIDPPLIAADYFTDLAQVALIDDGSARESRNRADVQHRLEREVVPWDIVAMNGEPADCLIRNAGMADLIVVNRLIEDPFAPDMRALASTLANKSRKPIVAVPQDSRGFAVNGPALVAWDGSLPVMTALTASVPLLKLAHSVILFEVQDGPERPSAEEAAVYLSRHGIHAMIERVKRGASQVDQLIQEEVTRTGATYCVMGAYGRSPVGEFLFGGVTRQMLGGSKVPLVIAH